MIETSIAIERDGLKGKVVIDSRGLPPRELDGKLGAYGEFDQLLRNLAALLKTKTQLTLVFDERPDVIQPAAAVDEVAVYCGWYSVDKYVPGMKLHARRGRDAHRELHDGRPAHRICRRLAARVAIRWLRRDGRRRFRAAAHRVPAARRIHPAAVDRQADAGRGVSRTTPMVSWKLSLIGDPLYTPYRTNPAIRAEDLPPQLSGALSGTK